MWEGMAGYVGIAIEVIIATWSMLILGESTLPGFDVFILIV